MILAVGVTIVLCVSGLFLLISGIWLMLRGRPSSPQDATEASLKEVIRLNVPAQALLVLVGAALLVCGGYFAVTKTQASETSPSAGSSPATESPTAPQTSPSASPTPAKVLTTPGAASATLNHPVDGTKVSRSRGFVARGTATSLGPYTVWILDYDSGYTVDQEATVSAGKWSALDQPLGDSSDQLPFELTMVAVVANPHCALKLGQIDSTSNDYTQSLPEGCNIFGRVTVDVSTP
jgi:hypothetical protein